MFSGRGRGIAGVDLTLHVGTSVLASQRSRVVKDLALNHEYASMACLGNSLTISLLSHHFKQTTEAPNMEPAAIPTGKIEQVGFTSGPIEQDRVLYLSPAGNLVA